jgi:hypothetical protein
LKSIGVEVTAAPVNEPFRLLDAFRKTFNGVVYKHRNPNLGNYIAQEFFEDLVLHGSTARFKTRVTNSDVVLSSLNLAQGIKSRRGDGTLGQRVPQSRAMNDPGFQVARGHVANIQIGVEVKIIAQAMIKQIMRVINVLEAQATAFRKRSAGTICVGIVGVNHGSHYTSHEGARVWKTDGKARPHPSQEARLTEARLNSDAAFYFDELLILKFAATNEPPYEFSWVNHQQTSLDYGAILTRISNLYESRFP